MWSARVARIRYLWAVTLTISIVGTLLALLGSSFGPIYYDHFVGGDRFDAHAVDDRASADDQIVHSYSLVTRGDQSASA